MGKHPAFPAATNSATYLVSGIAMHHIYCDRKKAYIVDRAQALMLGGYYVFGKPGRVVVEGERDNVLRYERDLRCLRWQKIQVMGRVEHFKRRLFIEEDPSQTFCLIECENEDDLFRKLLAAQLNEIVVTLKRPFGAPRSL
jgi:hypothetical protein